MSIARDKARGIKLCRGAFTNFMMFSARLFRRNEDKGMMRDGRLRWYGYIVRRDQEYVGKKMMEESYWERGKEGDQREGF